MTAEESIINITQLLQLTDLDVCEDDINWSRVKMNSFRWIAVRHNKISYPDETAQASNTCPSEAYYPHLFSASFRNHSVTDLHNSKDINENNGNTNGSDEVIVCETVITVLNPFTTQLYNCQTSYDTKCAQISADNDMIAISNDRFVAVYCVQTNKCLNTLPFPSKCLFWCWIHNNSIAIITDKEVFHWHIDKPFEPQMKFKVDNKIREHQITGYKCDHTNQLWFAITSLYCDDEGEINGFVQIHSELNQLSQCIEAHACTLSQYKFHSNLSPTPVLLAAKRNQLNTLKIYIIELGPIREDNCALISRTEVIPQLESNNDGFKYDIPVSIECNSELGLIFLFSKYGSLYICDIETGALITSAIISSSIIFTTCFDEETQAVLAIGRNGQLLSIELFVEQLIRHLNSISKLEIAQRIQSIVDNRDSDEDCDEVTRL